MPRFYVVQYSHRARGWTDLPSLASLRQLDVRRSAETFASEHHVVTRVIRKPKGWTPPSPEADASPEPVGTPVPDSEPEPWIDDPDDVRAGQLFRKQEKRRARQQAAFERIPTAWERILDDD